MEEIEIWKDIEGYEGYQVSNLGRVKSIDREISTSSGKRLIKGTIRKTTLTNGGYEKVVLYKGKKRKTTLVHRLVAMAFLDNPNNYPQVNHKDENKVNNTVFVNGDGSINLNKSNLEWCTNEYNHNYGTAVQRIAEKNYKKVHQYTLDGELVKVWESVSKAHKELNLRHIDAVARGERNKCGGYIWKYEN